MTRSARLAGALAVTLSAASCNAILGIEEGVFTPRAGSGGEPSGGSGSGGKAGMGGKGGATGSAGTAAGGKAGGTGSSGEAGALGAQGGDAGAPGGDAGEGGGGDTASGGSGGSSGTTSGGTTGEGSAGEGGQVAIDPCDANPCVHGTCSSEGSDYDCACTPGWDGPNCDVNINDCVGAVCMNGGTCVDGIESHTCDCSGTGYTGDQCETLVQNCSQSPCQHGGQCTDAGTSRTCDCSGTGFEGDSCEININDCNPNPCRNGAQCLDGVNDYECDCISPWEGTLCDSGNLTITARTGGWWDDTGFHNQGNQNTFTGFNNDREDHNSFLVFDIPNFTGAISALTLHLYQDGYTSANMSETIQVWDASTPVSKLLADGSGRTDIFDDLESGANYRGTFSVTDADVGSYHNLTLNSVAVGDVLEARGGSFVIAFHLSSNSGAATQESVRWTGGGGQIPYQQLWIEVVP